MSEGPPPAVCTYIYRHERPCHKRGERCSHPTVPGSPYCRWHQVLPDKDFRGLDFSNADEEHKHLCEAYLVDARFDDAILSEVLLHDANMHGASLTKSNLQGANLSQANLLEADLWGANLKGAILWGANLQRAQLILTQLQFADLVRADLKGAMFDEAILKYTDFRGADLQLAHFEASEINQLYLAGKFGSAQLMLCTLKNAASLENLVAQIERLGLRAEINPDNQMRSYTLEDYAIQPRDPRDIARDHQVLKIYFKQEGRLDQSSSHYLSEMRRMRQYYWNMASSKHTSEEKKLPFSQRFRWGLRGAKSKMLDTLFGYGEEPSKLIAWSLFSVLLTALALFWITAGVNLGVAIGNLGTYFSIALVSFAVAPPSLVVDLVGLMGFWITSAEAFLGKFFLALFVFILGRKVER